MDGLRGLIVNSTESGNNKETPVMDFLIGLNKMGRPTINLGGNFGAGPGTRNFKGKTVFLSACFYILLVNH